MKLGSVVVLTVIAPAMLLTQSDRPAIPKTRDEAALAEWATPVAELNVRPTHILAKEYYSLSVENLRTYPVYFPGREPEGYWDMLQHIGPKPLIEVNKLKTQADWIEAGQRVFDEADLLHTRTVDPKFIAMVRSPETLAGGRSLPDGTVFGMRWVPTTQGLALTFLNCTKCHLAYLPNGARIPGAPSFANGSSRTSGRVRIAIMIPRVQLAYKVVTGSPPLIMGDESFSMWLSRAFGVPWNKNDINEKMKTVTRDEYVALATEVRHGGGVPRWNGSLYHPAKVLNLIEINDRKYCDHTATHLHGGISDLSCYYVLV